MRRVTGRRTMRWALALGAVGASALLATAPLGMTGAGAQGNLLGYNATTLAVGAQFAFNVPNLVPLPNENIIEEDVPFARTNVGAGPVVDALSAPYYPGDVAADLGSLLAEFGAPPGVPNDPLLAESKYPASPGYGSSASFGVSPSNATPLQPSIFSADSDASDGGGDATGTLSDLALDQEGSSSSVPSSNSASPVDVGNISATDSVKVGASSVTDSASTQVAGIDIAGMVDIAGLTTSASATSDGTTGTPTSTLHLGAVTVDGQPAYIDNTGVHLTSASSSATGLEPAQLQELVNGTLSQDGITIALLSPTLTTNGAQASANAGGLQIAISHQLDVPFVPGEPTIPVPELGNTGLPAGLYTVTTSITFGLAQASVSASALTPVSGNSGNSGAASAASPPAASTSSGTLSGSVLPSCCTGDTGSTSYSGNSGVSTPTGSAQATAPAEAAGTPAVPPSLASSATAFPIKGIPPPLGWTITALLGCLILCYPLLLLARWQFIAPRRR
ncbi:MAG TPA: hypothetical protein VN886_05785 [Acidimicrobiales bacterium]|jgi:hypothetical protein|nr:hypothetical protein [Acidimicrobiales bacterium]